MGQSWWVAVGVGEGPWALGVAGAACPPRGWSGAGEAVAGARLAATVDGVPLLLRGAVLRGAAVDPAGAFLGVGLEVADPVAEDPGVEGHRGVPEDRVACQSQEGVAVASVRNAVVVGVVAACRAVGMEVASREDPSVRAVAGASGRGVVGVAPRAEASCQTAAGALGVEAEACPWMVAGAFLLVGMAACAGTVAASEAGCPAWVAAAGWASAALAGPLVVVLVVACPAPLEVAVRRRGVVAAAHPRGVRPQTAGGDGPSAPAGSALPAAARRPSRVARPWSPS